MKLVKYPNNILTESLKDFDFDSSIDPNLIESEMIEIMRLEKGIGLAANQVGLDFRVFVMSPQLLEDKNPFALFNPKVINFSQEQEEGKEGCLSFPNLFLKVKRSKTIRIEYLDKSKQKCIIDLTGVDARCALHELDHLNGVCFTDKVSKLKLDMALKKQRKLNGRTK